MDITNEMILEEIKVIAGIDAVKLFDLGLIPPYHARKWVVREKYFQMKEPGRTYLDIKLELSVIYDVSISAIEKMVYKKRSEYQMVKSE